MFYCNHDFRDFLLEPPLHVSRWLNEAGLPELQWIVVPLDGDAIVDFGGGATCGCDSK